MAITPISRGEAIAGAGGLLLFVLMFLPWFGGTLSGLGTTIGVPTMTGWESYGGLFDVLIALLVAIPVGIAAGQATGRLPSLPLEQGLMVLGAGALLVLLVGIRVLSAPDLTDVAIPNVEVDITRKISAFLALAAAAAVVAGGHLQRLASLASAR